MKLIKLTSSIKTFKTVNFNLNGFTIILADKQNGNQNKKYSLNGVGKSLIIYLIHFCLGCSKNEDLKKKIPDEYFELEFVINKKTFKSKRFTSEQDNIYLNDEKFPFKKFNEKLQSLIFPEINTKYLTFRNLISRFIRPYTYSYSSWDKWVPKEDKREHVPFLNTLYLLGFDPELIHKKFDLKEKLLDYDKKLKSFKKDPILQEYFKDANKDISMDIETLKQKIELKQRKLSTLNFSKDYYEIESKTKNIALELRRINNQIVLLNNALSNIEESLKRDFTKNSDFLSSFYEVLRKSMKEEILRNFGEIMDFHHKLLTNRKKRFKEQGKKIAENLDMMNVKFKKLIDEHNSYLVLLNKNAPFEQGLAIKEEINNFNQKLICLKQYDEIIEKYNSKISNTKLNIETENKNTENYLKEIKNLRFNIDNEFKKLVDLFYTNKDPYITIKNNLGNNTIRFNLNVKIDDDSSNGVREVEMFCFDIILYLLKKNVDINFLFHDSRLFANVDPTQVVTAFQIINNIQKEREFQYIVSLNKNQYNDIKEEFEKIDKIDEFNEIFNEDTIKLRLTKNDKGKLLGFQVDINYDIT